MVFAPPSPLGVARYKRYKNLLVFVAAPGLPPALMEGDGQHGLMRLCAVPAPRRALSSGTPTSRCRSATAGRRVRARGLPPGAGRAATGTRVALRSRPLLPARRHARP